MFPISIFNDLLATALTELLPTITHRIFDLGLASDEQPIGQYSSRPAYIPIDKAATHSPLGKTGKSLFTSGTRRGQPHRTRYYEGGYRQYKVLQGIYSVRPSASLRSSIAVITLDGEVMLGWHDSTLADRALALEQRYDRAIWQLTPAEMNLFITLIQSKIPHALSR